MNPFFKLITYLVTFFLIGVLGFFFFKFREDFQTIRDISPSQFLQMFFLVVLLFLINGHKLRKIVSFFQISLKTGEWFGLTSINTLLNNIFFKAGSLVTSNYLKRKYSFPYLSFAGSLGADQVILLFVGSLAGCFTASYLFITISEDLGPLAAIYLLVAVVLFLLMRGVIPMPEQKNFILDAVSRTVKALHSVLKTPRLFANLCLHNLGLIVLTSLRLFVVCRILHLNVPMSYCMLFTTIMQLVSLVPLFQSDIGARELAVGLFSEWVGIGFNEGFMVTIVDRMFVLFWALIFSGFFKNLIIPVKGNINKG